ERAHVAVDIHRALCPQSLDDLQARLEAAHPLAARHLEGIEFHVAIAEADAEDESPTPDDVEGGHGLRHLDGIVEPEEENPRHARHVPRLGGEPREERHALKLARAPAPATLAPGPGDPATTS